MGLYDKIEGHRWLLSIGGGNKRKHNVGDEWKVRKDCLTMTKVLRSQDKLDCHKFVEI